jgi:hypothetical protein
MNVKININIDAKSAVLKRKTETGTRDFLITDEFIAKLNADQLQVVADFAEGYTAGVRLDGLSENSEDEVVAAINRIVATKNGKLEKNRLEAEQREQEIIDYIAECENCDLEKLVYKDYRIGAPLFSVYSLPGFFPANRITEKMQEKYNEAKNLASLKIEKYNADKAAAEQAAAALLLLQTQKIKNLLPPIQREMFAEGNISAERIDQLIVSALLPDVDVSELTDNPSEPLIYYTDEQFLFIKGLKEKLSKIEGVEDITIALCLESEGEYSGEISPDSCSVGFLFFGYKVFCEFVNHTEER